jgi:outer membrane protein, heavy metal efflux system
MNRTHRVAHWSRAVLAAAAISGLTFAAHGQAAPAQPAAVSLARAYDEAWARQPEAQAAPSRRDAAAAQQRAARQWTPEALAAEAGLRSDRLTGNEGAREAEVGLVVPLWLPGERARSVELADAETQALESRISAARLRMAATVRELWWAWQRARIDAELARAQTESTRRIAADVARRTKAGDLARADQYQAEGAVATAEAALAGAEAAFSSAGFALKALTGLDWSASASVIAEPLPIADSPESDDHAALRQLQDRARVADRTAALAEAQRRANPELLLGARRERGAFGESYDSSLILGVRIPLGGGPRYEAKVAAARAEAAEAEAGLGLERERVRAERDAARLRVEAARMQLVAVERRARLAAESRGFFEKSFRLGETDLPTRLRIEAEAAEAERQVARSRIELAAAISAWRQALGLLPQ